MSQEYVFTQPPSATIFARTSASFSSSRATITTLPPASATRSAAASPMPEEPPVITTTLPFTAPRRLRSIERSGSRWRSQ